MAASLFAFVIPVAVGRHLLLRRIGGGSVCGSAWYRRWRRPLARSFQLFCIGVLMGWLGGRICRIVDWAIPTTWAHHLYCPLDSLKVVSEAYWTNFNSFRHPFLQSFGASCRRMAGSVDHLRYSCPECFSWQKWACLWSWALNLIGGFLSRNPLTLLYTYPLVTKKRLHSFDPDPACFLICLEAAWIRTWFTFPLQTVLDVLPFITELASLYTHHHYRIQI